MISLRQLSKSAASVQPMASARLLYPVAPQALEHRTFSCLAATAAAHKRHISRVLPLTSSVCLRSYSTDAPAAAKPSAAVSEIASKIEQLTLLETAALVKELKTRLNIADVVMAAPVAAAASPAAAAAPAADAAPPEEKAPEKTAFKVKLEKYDAAAKAKIIREIKNLIPGSNLVEAKKFVESVPKVIKENVPKEEADKMKALLEGLGATVVLE